VAMV